VLHELIDDLCVLFCEHYRGLTSDARKFPLGSRNPSQFYATIKAEHMNIVRRYKPVAHLNTISDKGLHWMTGQEIVWLKKTISVNARC